MLLEMIDLNYKGLSLSLSRQEVGNLIEDDNVLLKKEFTHIMQKSCLLFHFLMGFN